ncbi:MAG TPA: ATP-binding protein [Mycobacteriales bacterium]|nr:ATP-binding protein [Mycobacteriales bacterium]
MILVTDTYSVEDFASLAARESDQIELKTGVGLSPLQEALVAFSNASGGTVFVGVTNEREVVGRRLDQATEDRIHEAARVAHGVGRYRIREIAVGDHPIVAVSVHRREDGFAQTSDGRLLVRRGGHNVALIGHEAWDFMSHRALRRFERSESGVPLSGADPDLLEELCGIYGWAADDPRTVERLRERGLVTGSGILTIAGVLFLTDPAQSLGLGKAVVDVRRYPDDGPDYDRRVSGRGPLQRQVRWVTQFIIEELGSDLVVAGLYRYELAKLPEVVVREALANAVAHRSYELDRTAIVVELRPDKVVVTSPGRLPEPVTVETLRQAQAARNPIVIDILRRFGLTEDAGRGVDVMEDTMQQELLDPPRFSEAANSVRVELPLRGPITPRERGWIADLERRGQLRITDRLLLIYAARGERLTNGRAREILGADTLTARHALQRLRDSRLLEQHGERRGAGYVLSESIAPPAAFRMTPAQLDELILSSAADRPVTNETVRELTGLDRLSALSVLRRLVTSGRLVQVGGRRWTHYELPS